MDHPRSASMANDRLYHDEPPHYEDVEFGTDDEGRCACGHSSTETTANDSLLTTWGFHAVEYDYDYGRPGFRSHKRTGAWSGAVMLTTAALTLALAGTCVRTPWAVYIGSFLGHRNIPVNLFQLSSLAVPGYTGILGLIVWAFVVQLLSFIAAILLVAGGKRRWVSGEAAMTLHHFVCICSGLVSLLFFVSCVLALHARSGHAFVDAGYRHAETGYWMLVSAGCAALGNFIVSAGGLYRVAVIVHVPATY